MRRIGKIQGLKRGGHAERAGEKFENDCDDDGISIEDDSMNGRVE